jgi:hypothetical protein
MVAWYRDLALSLGNDAQEHSQRKRFGEAIASAEASLEITERVLARILHESGMPHIRARPKGEYLHRLLHFPWAQTVPSAAPPADAPFAFPPKALCSILKVY